MNTQAKGWLWLSLLLLTACSTTDFSDTATPTPLQVSTAADRSGAVNLPNAQLEAAVYIFTQPGRVKQVAFYLDNRARSRKPRRIDLRASYDFVGGA